MGPITEQFSDASSVGGLLDPLQKPPQDGLPAIQSFSRESGFVDAGLRTASWQGSAGDKWQDPQEFVGVSLHSGSRAYVPSTIGYRALQPADLGVLQAMHEALFPIKYEADFFNNAVSGRGIISRGAVDRGGGAAEGGQLIGFVTAKFVSSTDPEVQESDVLGFELRNPNQTMIYILTLGIAKPYRNLGIGACS